VRSAWLLLALLAAPAMAEAEEDLAGKDVAEIKVEGNRRAEAAAVKSVTRTRPGTKLSLETVTDDIRRIYSLRYFEDIVVDAVDGPDGVIVTFRVTEKPSIREIKYRGNDELTEEDIEEVVNLRQYSILDISEVKRNSLKIRDLYTEKGYFLADVTHEIKEVSEHEVEVTFDINEHAKVLVRRLTFLGNKDIPDADLKAAIATKEGGYFSFLTSDGNFKKEIFERDILVMNGYYYDRGYVNVKIGTPRITLSPDREFLYITVPIEEGEQYSIGGLEVKGDLLGPKQEIMDLLTVEPGELFNRSKLFQDLSVVGDFYKDKGFAYANVTPLTRSEDEKLLVHITVDIQKGKPVHIGRIEFKGNVRTRDKVIRREMRIYEGDLYSSTKLKSSKRNVTRLGFFETVEISERPGAADDMMDVVVEVKERHTGTFQIGAGFSSVESFIATAQVSQQNLFGRGQSMSFQGTLSGIRQQLNLSFTEPHLWDTDWLLSFDLFRFELDFIDFLRSSTGFDVTLGYRLTDDLSTALTYELADIDWAFRSAPSRSEGGITSSVKGSLTWDTRDNRLFPTSGQYHSGSLEWADGLLGSENLFTRFRMTSRYYYPLFWGLVFKSSGRYGTVLPHEGEPVPTFERFFVGGIQSVRGFERHSLGPRARLGPISPDDPLLRPNTGGEEELIFNFEIEFPIFPQVGIKGVLFNDFGQAFCGRDKCSANDDSLETGGSLWYEPLETAAALRASWGFGFRWFSPIGPLRFEWGFPYNPTEFEDPVVFEFTIGNML
jgi:outer membrane protein insertion porin family